MKKLFSVVSIFVLAITLTGCNTSEYEQQIADLETQIAQLQSEQATLEADNTELQDQIDLLTQQLTDLQNHTYDNIVTITITGLEGESFWTTFGFDDNDDYSLFEILDLVTDIQYTTSEFGHYIYGVSGFTAYTGTYFALYQNDVMSMVGADDVVMEDGDHFELKVEWWDTTQQAVYDALQLFMDNQLDDYLTDNYVDYNVLLGCHNLCDGQYTYDNINTDNFIENYVDGLTNTTVQDYFKAIMISNVVLPDTHTTPLVTSLNGMVTTGAYGQTALGLLALDSYDHGLDYNSYVTTALDYYRSNTPYNEGLDAGGIALVALSNYRDETGIQTLIDDYVEWIVDAQLPSGGVKTRDILWSGTIYPGTENAASIAQVIIGLVANDIDPASGDFIEGTTNLVLRLTEFQLDDGSFDWDLTDDVPNDKAFSTPQAFLALSSYFQYMNNFDYTNPYDFNEGTE